MVIPKPTITSSSVVGSGISIIGRPPKLALLRRKNKQRVVLGRDGKEQSIGTIIESLDRSGGEHTQELETKSDSAGPKLDQTSANMTGSATNIIAVARATMPKPLSLAQAFGAEEPSSIAVDSLHQQPKEEQAYIAVEENTKQPWYHCMLPDCTGTSAPEDIVENELLTAEETERRQEEEQDTGNSSPMGGGEPTTLVFRTSAPDDDVRDASLADNEERDSDGTDYNDASNALSPTAAVNAAVSATNAPNQRQHRRIQSDVGSPTTPIEGLPDTFFSTGSFESISGLSLASYGTTASAMLGGLDYDENDEKVISTIMDDKDDESVVSSIDGDEDPADPCRPPSAVEQSQPVPPAPTSIAAEIESRRQQNLEVPIIHVTSHSIDDGDHASIGTRSTKASSHRHDDDYSVISEDASMASAMRRNRELNAVPLKKIKHMIKEGRMTEDERKHMLELRSAIKSFGRHDLNVAHTLVTAGDYYTEASDYDRALSLHKEALTIYSTKLGDHDPRSVDCKVRIARVQLKQGKVDEALGTFCQSMHMREALMGEEHPSVGEVRMHVAEIQRGKGHAKEAAREVKKALRGYREAYGDDHPRVADAVESIAELYTDMGEHEKANLIYSEMVKLRAAIDGHESVSVSKALLKWSSSFEALGNSSRALKLMKQAYAALVKQEGLAGATTAEALEGVGQIYATIGRKDKAIKAYTRVLNIRRQTLGENDPLTASTFVTIGRTLKEVNQPEKSLKCMKRAMSIYTHYDKTRKSNEKTNEDIVAIADSLHQVGLTFEDHGDNSLALKAFSKEMSLRKAAHYVDRRRIARVLNAVGVIQCKRGKFKNAMEFFTEALVNMDTTGGRNATFAATLFNVGLALEKTGETQKAFQTYAETLMMYKAEGLTEDNPMVSKVINKIKKNPSIQIEVPVAINGKLPCSLLDGDGQQFEC